ncbi:MAG: restriction endonuclease subunit S [Acidobacteria bacterium]|nr:restriction endonuclease subunit S [Acidobacteriota bacterium]
MKWEQVPIGKVCHVVAGGTPKRSKAEFWGGNVPWVKISDMLQGTIQCTDECITDQGLKESAAKLLPVGTILISIFATIGRTATLGIEAATNQAIAGVLPKEAGMLHPPFLRYCLEDRAAHLQNLSRGVAQANINGSVLKQTPIPLPPLPEQKRIAAILDAADSLRAKRREALAQLDTLLQATFLDLFGDPVTNPKGWKVVELGQHTSKVGSGATPRGGEDSYKDEGVALIRSMNVRDGSFLWDDLARIDDAQAQKLDNVVVQGDDVLLNITGASVARVCSVPLEVLPARVNQHVCIIRPSGTINARFLEKLLLSGSMKHKLLAIAESGATRQAITKSQVLSLTIPLPPMSEQQRFARIVSSTEQEVVGQNRHLAELDNLFVSLQSRAFRGEL